MAIMAIATKPGRKPANPCFSSGPCAKRPGWTPQALQNALTGRSHRSKEGKARLKLAIDTTRKILGIPADYRIGIMPASDTGAFEAALWSMLGARGIDVLSWESFGAGWASDVLKELKLKDVRSIEAAYGELPDLTKVDFSRDVIFTWNGTTSGVRVPDGKWIAADRQGLTFVDATSAAFAQKIDWAKCDVTTYSWQKAVGGEGQHGVIVLSPRAAERLTTYTPAWPLPKIFRMAKGGKLIEGIFEGETINTPSMLCVEDYLDALDWAAKSGGLEGLIARADRNAAALRGWMAKSDWAVDLATKPATASNTSVCLRFKDPAVRALPEEAQAALAKKISGLLEAEKVALDVNHYRDAPPGLRIWCGSTVETSDVQALTPWLDWAYATARA
jgi:phosphoserine aminotransferase